MHVAGSPDLGTAGAGGADRRCSRERVPGGHTDPGTVAGLRSEGRDPSGRAVTVRRLDDDSDGRVHSGVVPVSAALRPVSRRLGPASGFHHPPRGCPPAARAPGGQASRELCPRMDLDTWLGVANGRFVTGLFIFARFGALLVAAPLLSSKSIPNPIRLGVSGALALILTPLFAPSRIDSMPLLIVGMAKEIVIGLVLGWAA